ncbi:four helix bundle protein [bacterium]|nr:four helix bundle protein [bacterium]
MKENIVYDKAFEFAIDIVETYKKLSSKGEHVLSKQLLKCGTSIGANIKESVHGQSKKDFLSKINIALKEASETEYWLELLIETKYLDRKHHALLLNKCKELNRLLTSIVRSTKQAIKGD